MGGNGKQSPGGGVSTKNATVNVSQQIKLLGIPNMAAARQTAKYLKLKDGSLEQKVMNDLIRHGGTGGLGAIRLRIGLPRDKLLDIKNVFKSLHDHGMLSLTGLTGRVNATDINDSQEASTLVTLAYIRRMRGGMSADAISALAGSERRQRGG